MTNAEDIIYPDGDMSVYWNLSTNGNSKNKKFGYIDGDSYCVDRYYQGM